MRLVIALACLLAMPTKVQAQEVILGLGRSAYNAVQARDSAVLSFDLRSRRLGDLGGAAVTGQFVVEGHARGDRYVGIGLAARWPLSGGWFVDASIAPGWYRAGVAANDLGSDLEFRSQVALGRTMETGRAWSVSLVHKSNAGTGRSNPGMNTVLLRWHQAF